MALLSFRGISTPSLPAQGEQRRSSYFNIPRGNSQCAASASGRGAMCVVNPFFANAQLPREPNYRRLRIVAFTKNALNADHHCAMAPQSCSSYRPCSRSPFLKAFVVGEVGFIDGQNAAMHETG
jgi:hypothetical protein